jgi:hypothetical protein
LESASELGCGGVLLEILEDKIRNLVLDTTCAYSFPLGQISLSPLEDELSLPQDLQLPLLILFLCQLKHNLLTLLFLVALHYWLDVVFVIESCHLVSISININVVNLNWRLFFDRGFYLNRGHLNVCFLLNF